MTVSYPVTQVAATQTTTILVLSPPVASPLGATTALLTRFQLGPGVAFTYPLTLDINVTGIAGSETFFVLILTNGNTYATLTTQIGGVPLSLIPTAWYANGTATSYELARNTVTADGTVSFNLDMALLSRLMASALSYTNPWNGSLLFWICPTAATNSFWGPTITLNAPTVIDYQNRDTGTPGLENSRWTRCPISGLKIPRGKMIMDGFRGILVSPDSYDPPEPDPLDWADRENPNEDG